MKLASRKARRHEEPISIQPPAISALPRGGRCRYRGRHQRRWLEYADEPTETTHSRMISRSTFHGTWPFTVDQGLLICNDPQAVTFNDAGTVYGINGTALDQGFKDLKPIWLKDPTGVSPRVTISDVLDQGLALCTGRGR